MRRLAQIVCGALPRPGIGKRQRLSVLRGIGWMRLSALRLPLFAGGESILALWLAKLGREEASRECSLLRASAKQSRGGLLRELDCFVASLATTRTRIRHRA
jgi:hypothetical protein